jgi:pimeloyl-ACP methyl ester carboxylesterase
MSDMNGSKAIAVEEWAKRRGQACLRFDYRGHGESEGNFADGTIGLWRDDALGVFDAQTEGPQVVVGSSMGGWIALLLALARPGRVASLVGIAAAPDFTEDLIWRSCPRPCARRSRPRAGSSSPANMATSPIRSRRR